MMRGKIFWRILGHFSILLIVISVMTLLMLQSTKQIRSHFQLSSLNLSIVRDLQALQLTISTMKGNVEDFLATRNKRFFDQYDEAQKDFDITTQRLLSAVKDQPLIYDQVQELESHVEDWIVQIAEPKVTLRETNLDPREYSRLLNDLTEYESEEGFLPKSQNIIRELYGYETSGVDSELKTAAKLSSKLDNLIWLVFITVTVVSILVGVFLARYIRSPVKLLQEGTQKLIEGKFEQIEVKRTDEIGQLAENFNRMTQLLYERDQKIQANYRRVEAYNEIITALNSTKTLDALRKESLRILAARTNSQVGAMYTYDEEKTTLYLVSEYGFSGVLMPQRSYALGEGIPGQCAADREVIDIRDVPDDVEYVVKLGIGEFKPKNIICHPILFQDQLLGVIVLGSLRNYSEDEIGIVNMSIPQVAVAMKNALNVVKTQKLSVEISAKNEMLRTQNLELGNANKIKADFLASMSHELRTPLNSIIGFTDLILKNSKQPLAAQQRSGLEKVLRNARNLLQLINDVLDISKIEAGRMTVFIEPATIESIIANCVMTLEPLIGDKPVKIMQSVQADIPELKTDAQKMRQVILNLLSNAAKFTEEGEIAVSATRDNKHVKIAVKDSGIGIEKKNVDLIFEEFQQVDSSRTKKHGGTGLGLPISRKLARMLGGDLTVETELGKGSTFTMTALIELELEVSAPKIPKAAEKEKIQPAPVEFEAIEEKEGRQVPDSSLILSIDDDPEVIEIIRNYLTPEGFSVIGAKNADEGIQKARELHPNLITLDIMMPGKDGWQTLRNLKADPSTRSIPVIIHSIIDNKPLAIGLGAEEYLAKPIDPNQLIKTAKRYLLGKQRPIVIADDNEDFVQLTTDILEAEGFRCVAAYDGREALEKLKQHQPALLLLDLIMPVMDGFEVVDAMQKDPVLRKIPVVIVTGKELTSQDQEHLSDKIESLLKKEGLTGDVISKKVREVLEQR